MNNVSELHPRKDLTAKLRKEYPHFDITIGSTEVHSGLTQIATTKENPRALVFKSLVSITVFEKLDATDPRAGKSGGGVVMRAQATGTSTESMESAEDNALARALQFLGA